MLVFLVGLLSLTLIVVKVLSFFRSCCIMWLGTPPDFTKLGQWAVVTGCTDGIGKAYAHELAKLGMDIVLISRSPSKLENTAAEIESKYKRKTKIIVVDFTGGKEIYDEVRKKTEGLDVGVLVNNVGMLFGHPDYFLQVDNRDKLYRDLIHCNMSSVTFMTSILLPKMTQKKKGVIINISSITAAFPCPLLGTYGASKAYVDSLSHALCNEYQDTGVIIQTVLPGLVSTNMSSNIQPTLTIPSATTFAKSALRTVGKMERTAGFWYHEYQLRVGDTLCGLHRDTIIHFASKAFHATRERVLKRKKEQQAKQD